MEFRLPKLKRKRQRDVQSFQDSEADKRGKNSSSKCTGILLGGSVLVQSLADITILLARGFYGKGIFSRSTPSHVQQTRRQSGGSSAAGSARPERKRARVAGDGPAAGESEEAHRRRQQLHTQWREERERLSSSVSQGSKEKTAGHPSKAGSPATKPPLSPTERHPLEMSSHDSSPVLESSDMDPDPYPVEEPLSLTSEEAFYLVAEVGLLNVHSPTSGGIYSTEELWRQFCSHNKRFPSTYTAYRHYRRKGWVPKSGLKYGADFLLYKEGPQFYHSTYAVLVREETASETAESTLSSLAREGTSGSGAVGAKGEVDTETVAIVETPHTSSELSSGVMESSPVCSAAAVSSRLVTAARASQGATSGARGLRWCDVVAHCRVCEAAAKEVIVCSVVQPVSWSEGQLASSQCVEELTIHEVSVTRWVPDRER